MEFSTEYVKTDGEDWFDHTLGFTQYHGT